MTALCFIRSISDHYGVSKTIKCDVECARTRPSHLTRHIRHTMPTIRQRGAKWQAIVRIKKDQAIVHQESRMFDSQRLAQDWAERLEAKIKRDGVPDRQLQIKTLGDLLQDYKERLDGVKPLRRTASSELDFLSLQFKSIKLSSVTSKVFDDFARGRAKLGTGPATVLHNLSTVRSALNSAKVMFGLQVDGAAVNEAIDTLARVGLVAKSRKRERRISQTELDTLVAEYQRSAAFPSTVLPMAIIVPLAVAFPRRRTELCSMTWEDYNAKKGVMLLRDTKHPRYTRDEVVPVPPLAQAIINALPVIDKRILPYEAESVSASFERACKRLGIEDARFHDLRHEGISRLFEAGLEIQEVAMISGHTSWGTLKRYTHLKPAQVLEKLNHAGRQKAQETPAEPAGT